MKKMMKFLKVITFVVFFVLLGSVQKANAIDTTYSDSITQHNDTTYVAPVQYEMSVDKVSSTNTTDTTSAGGKSTGNANIFAILKNKIYTTLVDLRKIVYVIAGFGLVMFAVLAIFNKVSYKHLGYIMVSLCLLSLMFPFLEYFSGDGTIQPASQTQMDFKNFLDTQYAVIQGTGEDEIQSAMNGKGQGGPSCNGEEGCEELDPRLDQMSEARGALLLLDEDEDERVLSVEDMNKAKEAGCSLTALNTLGEAKGTWNESGVRSICTMDEQGNLVLTQEQCTGKMNKKGDKCVKTAAQVWGDIVNGVTQTANFVASGVNTLVGVASTGAALVSGGTNIVNAMKDLGNAGNIHDVLAGLQNIAGATSGAATGVTLGLQTTLSGLGGAASSVGALATIAATNPDSNPTGANSVVTGAANFNQNLNAANENLGTNLGATNKALGEGAGVIRDVDNTVTTVESGIKTVTGIAGQISGQ